MPRAIPRAPDFGAWAHPPATTAAPSPACLVRARACWAASWLRLRGKSGEELARRGVDVAGSEGDDDVPGLDHGEQRVLHAALVGDVADAVMPVSVDGGRERLARGARDGFLAGRVDVGDEQDVRLVEAAREVLE